MSTAVCELRSTPAGEPLIPELVQPGDVVRTNYGTGPFRVIDVAGPYGHGCYSLILTKPDSRSNKPERWINELVAVGGRLLKLHVSNEDEVFVISKGVSQVTETKVPKLAQRGGRGTAAMPAIDDPEAVRLSKSKRKAAVKPKAEHYAETPIITPAARLTIYTAQDAAGQYYGSFAIEWAFVGLADHRTALTTTKCKKFELLDHAFDHNLHEARGYVERLRLNHLTDEQLAAILLVEEAIDKRVAEEALAEPVAPEVEQSAAAADVDLSAELQAIEWIEAKVECDLITRHPQNRDVPIPSVADLAESIRRTGRVLERVKLRDMGDGRYQMLSGERRWKAVSLILEWETIDADVATMSDAAARALLTICNTQRQDLNDIEKARDLQQLCMPVDEGGAGMTQEAAGDLYSMSQSHVANLIRLLAAPEWMWQLVIAGEMPSSFLRLALSYVAVPAIEKELAKQVAKWHKGGDPGEAPADRVPTRDDFHYELKMLARNATRSLTPAKLDWWSADSAKHERDRLFELTPEVEQKLVIVEVDLYDGKHPRATNTRLWDKLQKAAIPAAIKKWKDKKNKKADRSSKGASAKRERTPAEQKQLDQQRAKQLTDRITLWRHDWLQRLVAPEMDARPLVMTLGMRNLVYENAGLAAAITELLFERLDAPVDDWITLPNLSLQSVDALARHYGIDVESEWSGMQKSTTKPVEFETFFQLHDIAQLTTLAGELKVNVEGLSAKKQLVSRLTSQPRALALPKSIATLGGKAGSGKRKAGKK